MNGIEAAEFYYSRIDGLPIDVSPAHKLALTMFDSVVVESLIERVTVPLKPPEPVK